MTDRHDVIVWLDPGLVTGLAWWDPEKEVFSSWQYEQKDLITRLGVLCGMYEGRISVGYEKYIVTSGGVRQGSPEHSLKVIEQVELLSRRAPFALLPSMPSSARILGNTVMLRRLGWYKPGKPHANDAAMHTLAFLLREKRLPRHLLQKALHATA